MKLKKITKFLKDKLISKIPFHNAKVVINEDDGMLEIVEPNKDQQVSPMEIDIKNSTEVEDIIVYNDKKG